MEQAVAGAPELWMWAVSQVQRSFYLSVRDVPHQVDMIKTYTKPSEMDWRCIARSALHLAKRIRERVNGLEMSFFSSK
jgi:hypothetical protein